MKRKELLFPSKRTSKAMAVIAAIAAMSLVFGALSASACTFEVLGAQDGKGRARLDWAPVPGATDYDIYVRTRYGGPTFAKTTGLSGANLSPVTTDPQEHTYLVFARGNDDPNYLCVGEVRVNLDGDRDLAEITSKRIIPLAGSVHGANGSDFRTSLTITKAARRTGRIVFRPTGTVASDADPFLRYAFGDNDDGGPSELYWDDVVAAMGATGTGSLEIIPDRVGDETSLHVPPVSARVYNVAAKGTYGSLVTAVRPAEWFLDPQTQHASVGVMIPAVHGNLRRNVGFRTLTAISYRVFTPGEEQLQVTGTAPRGYTYFSSLDALVGRPVPDNAWVSVEIVGGYAIGFYTETDNVTNDPALVIGTPADLSFNVSWGYH